MDAARMTPASAWLPWDHRLAALWREGKTTRVIALTLTAEGIPFPCSKNAVIGRARRLREDGTDLGQPRPSVIQRKATMAVNGTDQMRHNKAARLPGCRYPITWPVKSTGCVWPMWSHHAGDTEPRTFCGKRHMGVGEPYCERHSQIAFNGKPEASPVPQPMVLPFSGRGR